MKLKNAIASGSCFSVCSGVCRFVLMGLLLSGSGFSFGDYKDDIGYTRLLSELGAGLPDGSGVNVTQVEADLNEDGSDVYAEYAPDSADSQFTGKTITDVTATSGAYSGHATGVGRLFYGNTGSVAPGITSIESYDAVDWLLSGFINGAQSGPGPKPQPLGTSSRIANHSWVGSLTTSQITSDILRRVDWVIDRDEYIQVIATNNGSNSKVLLSGSYNAISVGRTDGGHAKGTAAVDNVYTADRIRPDIVAPAAATSSATPIVASATTLLVETGHGNPGLSTSAPATNRNGDTIHSAERSEVIKAALMAGAERVTNNSTLADITDYRANVVNQTANGLDSRFGAGQLSVYNSYHIIAAGEQESIDDAPATGGLIGNRGFDYDPSFGGKNGSNSEASYFFSTDSGGARLTASLVWNINIDGGNASAFDGTATLFNLDLFLYDITGTQSAGDWQYLASSESLWENSENLWMMLDADRDYAMQVKTAIGQTAFDWDYALAWQVTAVPVPVAFWLFGSGLLGLIGIGGRWKKVQPALIEG